MRSINELGLDLEREEVRKKVLDFLMGANVEFKFLPTDSTEYKGKIIGYRKEKDIPDFSLPILAVADDFPVGWRHLDKFDTVIYGANSETEKVFTHISYIRIPDILADALVRFVKGGIISGYIQSI